VGAEILLLADKRYTTLSLPLFFHTKESYADSLQSQNLIWGIAIGEFLLICLLNLFLAALLRLKLFLWYALLQASMIIYLFADSGLSFKLLYPYFPNFNDLTRPFSLAFGIIPMVLFFNLLMDLKQKFPKLKDLNKLILLVYIPLYIIAIFTASSGDYAIQGLLLQINKIFGPSLLLILLIESVYCFYKKIRYSIFVLLSYLGTSIFFITYSLHQNELIPDTYFYVKSNYWGLLWKLIIMSIALTYRYKYFKNKLKDLQEKTACSKSSSLPVQMLFRKKKCNAFHPYYTIRLGQI